MKKLIWFIIFKYLINLLNADNEECLKVDESQLESIISRLLKNACSNTTNASNGTTTADDLKLDEERIKEVPRGMALNTAYYSLIKLVLI